MPLDGNDDELSLDHSDDDIAADWAQISARLAEEDGGNDQAAEQASDAATEQRARDDAGRFAKAAAETQATKPVETAQDDAQGAQTEQTKPEQSASVNVPPSSWTAAGKAKWQALDPEVRAEIVKREGDMAKARGQLIGEAEFASRVKQVIEPYRMLIESEGGTPETAIAGLLQTAAIFRVGTPAQKAQAYAELGRQYGIAAPQQDMEQGQQAEQGQQFRDPRVDQLLGQLRQQQEMEQRSHQARQVQEAQQREQAANRWLNETDASGQPLRPYASNVIEELVGLVPVIQRMNPGISMDQVWQKAYEKAVWANPETQTLQLQAHEAKRREDILRTTAEAKKAASVNVPRRAGLPNAAPLGTMDQTITEEARRLGFLS